MEHINRLKRVHQDSVDLMKTEFMSQIARLKVSEFSKSEFLKIFYQTIHNDEIEALKTASGTTSDVKDILIKVDMATASLHTIAERIESTNGRNSNHAECKFFEKLIVQKIFELVISELNKFMGVIKLERKQFESERERMLHFITEMDRYNREQRELRSGSFIDSPSRNEIFIYETIKVTMKSFVIKVKFNELKPKDDCQKKKDVNYKMKL